MHLIIICNVIRKKIENVKGYKYLKKVPKNT